MSQTKDTKTLLLKAAMELIWKNSYGAVSVDDICSQAGVRKGSFYHFFSSKYELAKSALEDLWQELQPQLDHIFSPHVPALERLRAYAKFSYETQKLESLQFGFVVGCPFTTLGSEKRSNDEGLAEISWEILQRFRKYFAITLRDACEEGALDIENYEEAANEIFLHYLGCNAAARLSGSLEPLENLYERWHIQLKSYVKDKALKKRAAA